ncbi:MAG: O-antigen ligase family protein [Anaerolineae bacterium]|nr:O-antigen ligase family protein [Anaerolineae bacterium]
MKQTAVPFNRDDLIWYGAALLTAVGGVLLGQWIGYGAGLALLAAVVLIPAGLFIFWRRPESSVFLILILVTFGSEYSQTEWGVRSADQLTTIYNRRILPGVIASLFDLIFVAILALWAGRKWLRREPLAWLPRRLWLPVLLSLAFTFYAAILGFYRLPQGYELYHIMRELRPFVYALVLLVTAVDVMTTRGKVYFLWRFIILLAFARGIQGIIRHYLGIGRWYYGTTMVYYDYADTILLLAGIGFLVVWLLGQNRWRLSSLALFGLAVAPMIYSFVFSFRRSFWIGTAVSLALLLFLINRSEKWRYLALAGSGILALAALILLSGQLDLVSQRIVSVTDTQNDPSNYFRIFDTENALNAIYESAGLGMGFGSRYRVVASIYWLHDFISHVSRASHNGYFYLAMKMGLLGLLSWTLFWLANLSICLALLPGRFRHLGLGVGLVLMASAVANLFLPLYYNLRPMLMLSLFCALAISAWKLEQAEQRL